MNKDSCIIITLILIFSIFSQTAKSAENEDIEAVFDLPLTEIMSIEVITDVASMFPEDDLIVGSSVSTITLENMRKKGVRRLKDALENELSITSNLNMGGAYVNAIRGYTKKTSSGVSMLVDGIPVSSAMFSSPYFNVPDWRSGTLDRIELIKGPGSAIYGSEAFHGVISLKTFESEKNYSHVEGAYATPSYGNGGFQLSRGFNNDRVRINMAAETAYQGDQNLEYTYNDTVGLPDYNIPPETGTGVRKHLYDCQTGVFKVRFTPKERVSAGIGYYVNRFYSEQFPGAYYQSGHNLRDYDYSGHDALMNIVSGTLSYETRNDITVSTDAYFWREELKGVYSIFWYPEHVDAFSRDVDTRSSVSVTIKQPENKYKLTWLVSGSYTDIDIPDSKMALKQVSDGTVLSNTKLPYYNFSRQIKSIYGQVRWAFIENKAYLLTGGRLDSYSDVGDQTTPRLGIIFLPTQNSSVKALYGRGFNAPSAYNLYGSSVTFKGNENIKPEILDVYELIYMYRNEISKLTISGFYSTWNDGIILEPYNNSDYPQYSSIYVNRGKNHAYGVETSYIRKYNAFAFDTGFSYIISENLDVEDPYNPGRIDDFKYDLFPTYTVLFGLYYTLMPYKIDFYLNNRIYMDWKEYSITETTTSAGPPDRLDTYFRTDLTVSKALKKGITLYVSIRNLFNRDNYLPSVFGVENGVLEPGISGMVRIGYTF